MTIISWDIFCRVVDNFGDVGVSWRLARQLAVEHRARVRLWVDDLASLHAMCPGINLSLRMQVVLAVEIRLWDDHFEEVQPAAVAIEAFGCGLPDAYVARIVEASPNTLWITLEYLSAEPWVASHHGLPSPHPRHPVRRYFFFPGFTPGTGGVLRETDVLVRRDAFDIAARGNFWRLLGFSPPAEGGTTVSLFAYAQAPLEKLLGAWVNGTEHTVAVIPQGQLTEPVARYMGLAQSAPPALLRRGALETRFVPFLPQADYDSLLWVCDFNFVRGEDSFVRAQWAGRPFVWQAYPQSDNAHWAKIEAFLALYVEYLPQSSAQAIRKFWHAWNGADDCQAHIADAWREMLAHSEGQQEGLATWARDLAGIGDLAANLARFCKNTI